MNNNTYILTKFQIYISDMFACYVTNYSHPATTFECISIPTLAEMSILVLTAIFSSSVAKVTKVTLKFTKPRNHKIPKPPNYQITKQNLLLQKIISILLDQLVLMETARIKWSNLVIMDLKSFLSKV